MNLTVALALTLASLIGGFSDGPEDGPVDDPTSVAVVEIIARGMTFEAPDEVPSGWVTFRLRNESDMIHFALIERMPEGTGLAEQQEQIAPIFQDGMDLLNAGKPDEAIAAFGTLPEWFGEIAFVGGPGLTSPGLTSEVTVHLTPGRYLLECYIKTDGIFHSYNPDADSYGMMHEFTVVDRESGLRAPEPSLELSISAEGGISFDGDARPGRQIVAVHFEDQQPHENFVGHDVNLVRLEDDTDLDELVVWMDWTQPTGLETPAPAQFIGGTEELPAGSTTYLNVDLRPGRYAWIAEVPRADEKGMLVTFTVPPAGSQ